MYFRTAEPMTAQDTRKGEPSLLSMRKGLRPQPAHLVRGSSRRIMSMRFRPANIRVINRRESSSLSSARLSEPSTLKAHQQERVPATPPVQDAPSCQSGAHSARVCYAAPQTGARLPAPRRSGPMTYATGGSGGNTSALSMAGKTKKDRSPSPRKTGLTSGFNQSGAPNA